MNGFGSAVLSCVLLCACRSDVAEPAAVVQDPPPTNRIEVPELVRKNLGIEFVTVERRRVARTVRVPGHFELLPSARREHRAPVAGRVEILVEPLQQVEAGELLFRIDAPDWRRMQRELGDLGTNAEVTQARVVALRPLAAAHRAHEQSLRDAIAVLEGRIETLRETRDRVGGQAEQLANAGVQLAQIRADLAQAGEKHAETEAQIAELQANLRADQERIRLGLAVASALAGVSAERLAAVDATGTPAWRSLTALDVRATAAGTVDDLPAASGAWVDAHELVASVVDATRVRFRARGLQSDVARFGATGVAAVIPASVAAPSDQRIAGRLVLGPFADPIQRTVDLFVAFDTTASWARPGIVGFAEIETESGEQPELVVPLGAVVQDGLQRVLFRRDPADKDRVIRIDGDLGIDDGRWIEVKSGIKDGDEVVVAGAYELMLASSGTVTKGGHVHADGTFHEDHE